MVFYVLENQCYDKVFVQTRYVLCICVYLYLLKTTIICRMFQRKIFKIIKLVPGHLPGPDGGQPGRLGRVRRQGFIRLGSYRKSRVLAFYFSTFLLFYLVRTEKSNAGILLFYISNFPLGSYRKVECWHATFLHF
jgi:hypothetical protein